MDEDYAVVEQRVEELKSELHADGFCMRDFFATESAFLAVLFASNLLSLSQKVAQPTSACRQPATLRAAVFFGGAVLGRAARKPVILIAQAWGAPKAHRPHRERFGMANPDFTKVGFRPAKSSGVPRDLKPFFSPNFRFRVNWCRGGGWWADPC